MTTTMPTIVQSFPCNPVPVPRKTAVEFLVAHASRNGSAHGMKLIHKPRARETSGAPSVLCPCDHGPNNCVTAVPLKNVLIRLEGWLLLDLYAGQCPHCGRIYWS